MVHEFVVSKWRRKQTTDLAIDVKDPAQILGVCVRVLFHTNQFCGRMILTRGDLKAPNVDMSSSQVYDSRSKQSDVGAVILAKHMALNVASITVAS